MVTLYYYAHCPFCIRVRLALGFLQIPHKTQLLHYADEVTPVNFIEKKMTPILKKIDGSYMGESLDIIRYLDSKSILGTIEDHTLQFLDELSPDLYNLLMPYYGFSAEFDDKDRLYFRTKKEIKRGPFKILVQKREFYLSIVETIIDNYKHHFEHKVDLNQIVIASQLWGLFLVNEYRMPKYLYDYLQFMKENCRFVYDLDFWN